MNTEGISARDKLRFDKIVSDGLVPEIDYFVFRKCSPSWQILADRFPIWDITYVTQGTAAYIIDGTPLTVKAGDILCLQPGHTREAKPSPKNTMQCYSCNFELRSNKGKSAVLPFPLISNIGVRKDIIRQFQDLSFTWLDRQSGYKIKAQGVFTLILHRLFELIVFKIDTSADDDRVKKITKYIAKHYSEKLSVRRMAELSELNPVYCGALFKKTTGVTMNQYQIRMRVRNAENMLRSGEYKVKQTAEYCGFCDLFHMYKQFKAILGIAPSQCMPKRK
jgi:AraC-like DNA-binding protein